MFIKTEGFVLKNTKYGETDSLLTLFSRKLGKINAIAKGGRRPKSSLLAGIQPFCYSEFVLYKGKGLYTINQCEVKESFYSIREDLEKLSYGAYMMELVEVAINEGQTNNRLFNLVGKTLFLLKSTDVEVSTLVRAFELKLMHYAGYKPEISRCVGCGNQQSDPWKFSANEGGLLCQQCFSVDPFAMKMNLHTIKLANYLLHKDMTEIKKLKISKFLNEELKKILKQYIATHMNKHHFKSLEIIDQL